MNFITRRNAISCCLSFLAAGETAALVGSRPQFPNLFASYKARPPWQVAGVDFPAGHSAVHTLIDVSISPPAGTEYSNGVLTVTRDHVTIAGYDFASQGGIRLYCPSSDLTIRHCRFGGPHYFYNQPSTGIIDFRGHGLSFFQNTIDASGGGGPCLIFLAGSGLGRVSIKWNWFKNFGSRLIEILAAVALDMQHNLIQNGGQGGSSVHMNYLEWDSDDAIVSFPIWSFNTVYQQAQNGTGEGPQWYTNGHRITYDNPDCSHNTVVTIGSGAMTYCFHGSKPGDIHGTGTLLNNYVDASGAFGAFYPRSFAAQGWIATGNVDLVTGGRIIVT